jgi:hypothetical protein
MFKSIRKIPIFPVYFIYIHVYFFKKYSGLNSCPILIKKEKKRYSQKRQIGQGFIKNNNLDRICEKTNKQNKNKQKQDNNLFSLVHKNLKFATKKKLLVLKFFLHVSAPM